MGPLRPFAPALLLGLLVSVGSCDWIVGPGSRPDVVRISELPRALTVTERVVIEANNAFGFDLLREVFAGDPDENLFLSPLSASVALGMALNGAAGETFDAVRHTLRLTPYDQAEINVAAGGLFRLLSELDPGVEIALANAVWHREEIALREDFRDRIAEVFDARVEGLDFSTESAPETINGWVRDATKGRIEEMVASPIPGSVVAYLMNAVYFHADWSTRFNPALTEAAPFHLADGSTRPMPLMMRDDSLRFHRTERFDAVDLPYGGEAFSMTVLVPRGGTGVHELVAELGPESWSEIVAGMEMVPRVRVYLPRFELEWAAELNDPLKSMGMEIAFDPGLADFSRMFEAPGPWIDEVKQKSFVRVDEEGTEAAAVTSISFVRSGPPEVRADRPFVFAIRERHSGTILFLGVLVEPPSS